MTVGVAECALPSKKKELVNLTGIFAKCIIYDSHNDRVKIIKLYTSIENISTLGRKKEKVKGRKKRGC